MPNLILIRHSTPQIEPDLPAKEWRLSDEGRARCQPLAERLTAYDPSQFVASLEPKALETAQIVAGQLNKPLQTAEGLHEHERSRVGYLGRAQFEAAVATFFEKPDQLVFGDETADQCHARFAQTITRSLTASPDQTLAVVTHGTVLTLFVSRATGLAPFPFWKALSLPMFAVLSLPEQRLIETVSF